MEYIVKLAALVLVAAVLLVSCGAARPYETGDARALVEAGVFNGEMAELESSVIARLYGISDEDLADCAGYQAVNTAVSADEVTVLVLTSEEAAEDAEELCRKRLESLEENCRSYCPDALPSVEAAVLDRVGTTVLFAVGDPDRLPDAVGRWGNKIEKPYRIFSRAVL